MSHQQKIALHNAQKSAQLVRGWLKMFQNQTKENSNFLVLTRKHLEHLGGHFSAEENDLIRKHADEHGNYRVYIPTDSWLIDKEAFDTCRGTDYASILDAALFGVIVLPLDLDKTVAREQYRHQEKCELGYLRIVEALYSKDPEFNVHIDQTDELVDVIRGETGMKFEDYVVTKHQPNRTYYNVETVARKTNKNIDLLTLIHKKRPYTAKEEAGILDAIVKTLGYIDRQLSLDVYIDYFTLRRYQWQTTLRLAKESGRQVTCVIPGQVSAWSGLANYILFGRELTVIGQDSTRFSITWDDLRSQRATIDPIMDDLPSYVETLSTSK